MQETLGQKLFGSNYMEGFDELKKGLYKVAACVDKRCEQKI